MVYLTSSSLEQKIDYNGQNDVVWANDIINAFNSEKRILSKKEAVEKAKGATIIVDNLSLVRVLSIAGINVITAAKAYNTCKKDDEILVIGWNRRSQIRSFALHLLGERREDEDISDDERG